MRELSKLVEKIKEVGKKELNSYYVEKENRALRMIYKNENDFSIVMCSDEHKTPPDPCLIVIKAGNTITIREDDMEFEDIYEFLGI